MEFNEQIKQFSERVINLKDNITTEEATKMSCSSSFSIIRI